MKEWIPNNALKPLDVLVGRWNVVASEMSFFPDQSFTSGGQDSFEWFDKGGYLIMRSQADHPEFPDAMGIIGLDDLSANYTMLYFDSRGVSRIYQMSLGNGVLKFWRDAPGFSQRFTGTFSDDNNTIKGRWEKSEDGSNWEHDFTLTYTKIG